MALHRRGFLLAAGAAGLSLAAPGVVRGSDRATLERLAGSCLLVGFAGKRAHGGGARALAAQIGEGFAAGALLLRHNFGERAAVDGLTALFADAGADLPSLLSIDQEGGKVQRLGRAQGFTRIPQPREVASRLSVEDAARLYATLAGELRALRFNFNLAPVVDLHDAANPAVGRHGRAFSADPDTVVRYASVFIEAHRQAKVLTALKHFPGQGHARGDTHDGFVDITTSWKPEELAPFKALIRAGLADSVMGGHLAHRGTEADGRPLIFSRAAIEGTLRGALGFSGVVLTDDLDMGAIRKRFDLKTAVVLALNAGNDLLMLSNSLQPDQDIARRACGWIADAVEAGHLPERRLRQAASRVDALRARLA